MARQGHNSIGMKKHIKLISSLAIAMMVLLSSFSTFASHAAACNHKYTSHQNTGAGYTEDMGSHIHNVYLIGSTTVYEHCDRTKVVEFCYRKCEICRFVDTSSTHEHSYIRHSCDNSTEPL